MACGDVCLRLADARQHPLARTLDEVRILLLIKNDIARLIADNDVDGTFRDQFIHRADTPSFDFPCGKSANYHLVLPVRE